MSGVYKVVLNGMYAGKDNQSILWYRAAVDVFGGMFGMGGAVELADQLDSVVVPKWLKCKPQGYKLQTIDIYPHNDAFELAYQMPYKLAVDADGTSSVFSTGTDGPALAVNLRFNLEPVFLSPSRLYAPRNGYIAIGPIPSNNIDNNGMLVPDFYTQDLNAWQELVTAVTSNLTSVAPPAVFFPIRVTQKWGLVGSVMSLLGWGWADIEGGTYDRYVTFRRTRRIRG